MQPQVSEEKAVTVVCSVYGLLGGVLQGSLSTQFCWVILTGGQYPRNLEEVTGMSSLPETEWTCTVEAAVRRCD